MASTNHAEFLENERLKRHEVVDCYKEFADVGEWDTDIDDPNRIIKAGHAQWVFLSNLYEVDSDLDEAQYVLAVQSATGADVTVRVPDEALVAALKTLADDDQTEGLVRRIGDLYWVFYYGKSIKFPYWFGQCTSVRRS